MAMIKPRLHPRLDIVTTDELVNASVTSGLPPPGFDPLRAPQFVLDQLGFPKRPDPARQPGAYAFWQRMFAPPLVFDAFKSAAVPLWTRPRRAFVAQFSPEETSLNWSGAYITPRDGTVFSSIWGAYQVPTPNIPAGGTANKYRSSTWVGFDGQRRYYMSTLPQFGTAQNIDFVNGVPTRSYFAWWQWWARDVSGAAFPIKLAAPDIHPGDLIMLFMQVASDRGGVSFVMKNVTTGSAVNFFQGPPPAVAGLPFKVSGATAEWVMERSADAGDPTPLELPDYGTVDFQDCGAVAINPDTGATIERSLSAAKLIDMYVVRDGSERIVKNSIAERVNTTDFLTVYR
jgi:Peptidase A4 family